MKCIMYPIEWTQQEEGITRERQLNGADNRVHNSKNHEANPKL